MTDLQMCTACNHVGLDVRAKVVKLDPPWRLVHDDHSGTSVPEMWRREPRCTDPEACRSRQERSA